VALEFHLRIYSIIIIDLWFIFAFYLLAEKTMGTRSRDSEEQITTLLKDTVMLLCRNGLDFTQNVKVQGLLGITIDNDQVFLVQLDELYSENITAGNSKTFVTTPRPSAREADTPTPQKRRRRSRSTDTEETSSDVVDSFSLDNKSTPMIKVEPEDPVVPSFDANYSNMFDCQQQLALPIGNVFPNFNVNVPDTSSLSLITSPQAGPSNLNLPDGSSSKKQSNSNSVSAISFFLSCETCAPMDLKICRMHF